MDTADRLERIAATLADRGVNFVVIGGWAVEAQGYELGYKTEDIDFTPDLGPDNLDQDADLDLGL
ncbi:MAG: nucleotidyltransferase [bacterium]|nr:nucleotidyltransferase [bacterium]MCY4135717.1 nucleotidyltransferase [bacterium]